MSADGLCGKSPPLFNTIKSLCKRHISLKRIWKKNNEHKKRKQSEPWSELAMNNVCSILEAENRIEMMMYLENLSYIEFSVLRLKENQCHRSVFEQVFRNFEFIVNFGRSPYSCMCCTDECSHEI